MEEQGIRFKVYVDDAGVAPALKKSADGFTGLGAAADKAGAQVRQFSTSQATVNRFLQSISLQSTDVAQQLASGQSPFTVLLQQGGQVVQQSGGLRATFSALGQAVTPVRFAVGTAAAALTTFAAAAYAGRFETEELRKTLSFSGNQLGLTIGRVDELARSAAALSGGSIGNAREAVLQLAASGSFAADAMGSATRAVTAMQRLTGQSADEIVKDLAGMRNGVAQWAATHNRSFNYISAAQVAYLRELEAQGRTQEAVRLNMEQYAQTAENRLAPSLGLIERGLQAIKNAGSTAWDWMKDLGRETPLEQELARVQKQIEDANKSQNAFAKVGLPDLEQQRDNLRRSLAAQRQFAAMQAADAAEQQKLIEEQSKGHQSALAAVEKAASRQFYQQRQSEIDARARQEDEAYRRFETSGQTYRDQMIRRERDRLDIEEKRAKVEIFIERNRAVVANSDEALQRDARLIDLETALVAIKAKRAELEDRIRNGQAAVPPARQVQEGVTTSFRLDEIGSRDDIERSFSQRRDAVRQFSRDLVDENRKLSIRLIEDDRQRGLAQIQLEQEEITKRLDLGAYSAEERKRIENDLAEWRVLRERQLTEELKPEFQRRREMWEGTFSANEKTRQSFVDGMVTSGEEGFKAWVKEGKSAIDTIAGYMEDQFLTIFYRRVLQKPLENFANSAFDALGSFFTAGLFHSGGVVGAGGGLRQVSPLAFAGAPRYHAGGIAGDEVPAILRRGEEVLTASDPRHVRNGGMAGGDTLVLHTGGNTFGSDISRPEIVRYVDQRDRRLLAQVRDMMARGK